MLTRNDIFFILRPRCKNTTYFFQLRGITLQFVNVSVPWYNILWGVVAVIAWSWIYNYICNQCLSPLMLWVGISIRARCRTLYDKVCQWLATGQWFSPCPPVSSTNKTDLHDTTGILLKVALNTTKQTNNTLIRNGWPMVSRSKSHNSRLRRGLNECLVFVDWCQVPCTLKTICVSFLWKRDWLNGHWWSFWRQFSPYPIYIIGNTANHASITLHSPPVGQLCRSF